MEIFIEKCYGTKDENATFFLEWHKAIIRDFNKFKIILEKYENSKDKDRLISILSYIGINLSKGFREDDELILKSTPNYFLFSLYDLIKDSQTYVLISKDFKRFLIASEDVELFDEDGFNEDDRYGIYTYDYFFLENNKVKYINTYDKEYTWKFNVKFDNVMSIEESEKYYNSLLDQKNVIKKLTKNIK